MLRKLIALVVVGFALYSAQALALGLGDIELKSALNQPFDATIKLVSSDESELEGLRVGLASNADFERIGAVRSPFLNGLKFDIVIPERGKPFIKVSSTQPIKEPFVDFILEANWPAGRLLREYTVLLDPPTITTERAAPVQAPSVGRAPTRQAAPEPAPRRQVEERSEPAGIIQPTTTASGDFSSGDELVYGPVKSTDTLWNIADSMRPSDNVSVQQMMIALQKQNPEAFGDNNINNLKRGSTLSIKDQDAITELTHREAVNEAARQYQNWLAAKEARRAARGDVAKQEAVTSEAEATDSSTSVAEGSSEETTPEGGLRLLADDALEEDAASEGGVADVEGATSGEIDILREELELTNFAAEAAREQNAELRDRLTQLEEQIQAMQRALELKDDTLTQLQQKLSEGDTATADSASDGASNVEGIETLPFEEKEPAEVVEENVSPIIENDVTDEASSEAGGVVETIADDAASEQTSEEAVASEPEVAEPEAAVDDAAPSVVDNIVGNAKDIATDVKESFSTFMDDVSSSDFSFESIKEALKPENILASYRDNPLIYRIVSGIILVLLILGIIVRRRRNAAEEEFEEFAAPTMEDAASEEEIDEISDDEFGIGSTDDGIADVLSEADVYLSYDRHDKAETILKHAIDNEPARADYKAKLLEVYHAAKDNAAFVAAADRFYPDLSADQALWPKVNQMGLDMAPDHHLFKQVGDDSAEFDSIVGFDELDELDQVEDDISSSDSDDYADINLEMEVLTSDDGQVDTVSESVEQELDLSSDDDVMSELEDISAEAEELYDEASKDLETEFAAGHIDSEDQVAEVAEAANENVADVAEHAPSEFEAATAELEPLEPASSSSSDVDNSPSLLERAMENVSDDDLSQKYGSTNPGDDSLGDPIGTYDPDSELSGSDDDFDPSSFDGVDVNSTKLDLAKAYIDMGDQEGARSILGEVVAEGSEEQKQEAQDLIDQL